MQVFSVSDKLGEKTVYFSQSLIKYLTCLIIEAHDSPRAVRYVGVLGWEIKEVWCLAWRNHLLLTKKKNQELSFLSVVYKGAQVSSFNGIIHFKASYITSNNETWSVSYHHHHLKQVMHSPFILGFVHRGLINYFYNRFLWIF